MGLRNLETEDLSISKKSLQIVKKTFNSIYVYVTGSLGTLFLKMLAYSPGACTGDWTHSNDMLWMDSYECFGRDGGIHSFSCFQEIGISFLHSSIGSDNAFSVRFGVDSLNQALSDEAWGVSDISLRVIERENMAQNNAFLICSSSSLRKGRVDGKEKRSTLAPAISNHFVPYRDGLGRWNRFQMRRWGMDA